MASPGTQGRSGGVGRLRGVPRLIAAGPGTRRRTQPGDLNSGLRGPNRAMAEALDQLRSGVPLNWSQVEGSPELIALAALHAPARECHGLYPDTVPSQLRRELFERLASRLPEPTPEPVKAPPKSLAGFSENVPVLTQAEDDIPSSGSRRILLAVGGVAALLLLFLGFRAFSGAFTPPPSLTWIEARKGAQVVVQRRTPKDWQPLQCVGFTQTRPPDRREFITVPSPDQANSYLSYKPLLLPTRLTSPGTYTLRLADLAIAPCTESVPDPADKGTTLKLIYSVARQKGRAADVSTLVFFQGKQQPTSIDVSTGTWKSVTIGDMQGVYWQGGPYRDQEGTDWIGEVSVLILEQNDLVMTLVGQPKQGVDETMLTHLVTEMAQERQSSDRSNLRPFTWIEVRQGDTVLSPRQLPSGWQAPECAATPDLGTQGTLRHIPVSTFDLARTYVGYPILSLPISGTAPITYSTQRVEAAVRPCGTRQLRSKDLGARVRLRYTLEAESQVPAIGSLFGQFSIVQYEQKREPATIDVKVGQWQEVSVGSDRGVFWSGDSYTDVEGNTLAAASSVLMFEREDYVFTLIGNPERGLGRDELIALARQIK